MPCKDIVKRRAYQKLWQANNPDKAHAWTKRWRADNPDKVRCYHQRYHRNHKKQVNASSAISSGVRRADLAARYIKRLLCQRSGLRAADISQELVELKRMQIKIHREIKTQLGK